MARRGEGAKRKKRVKDKDEDTAGEQLRADLGGSRGEIGGPRWGRQLAEGPPAARKEGRAGGKTEREEKKVGEGKGAGWGRDPAKKAVVYV